MGQNTCQWVNYEERPLQFSGIKDLATYQVEGREGFWRYISEMGAKSCADIVEVLYYQSHETDLGNTRCQSCARGHLDSLETL